MSRSPRPKAFGCLGQHGAGRRFPTPLRITPPLESQRMLLANRIQTAFTEEGQEIPLNGGGVIPINRATWTSGQFGSQFGDGLQCGCFNEVSRSGQPQPFAIARCVKPLNAAQAASIRLRCAVVLRRQPPASNR